MKSTGAEKMMENLGRYYEWADNRVIALLEALDKESFVKVLEGTQRSLRDLPNT